MRPLLIISFVLAVHCLILPHSGQSQSQGVTDSLEKELSQATNKGEQFYLLLQLAKNTQINSPKKAADHMSAAKQLINFNKASKEAFDYYSHLSRVKLYQHQYDTSIIIGEKALELQEYTDPKDLIHVYATIGTCHYYTSSFENAIEAHFNALKIADETDFESEKSNIYNNISVVYMAMEDMNKAEEYLTKAMNNAKEYGRDDQYSRGTSNLAIVYAIQGKYYESAEMFKTDIETNKRVGNKMGVSHNYTNLGQLYGEAGDLKESLENYTIGLQIAEEIDDKPSIALGYQNVAGALSAMGKYEEAIPNYEKGMNLARRLGNKIALKDGLFSISKMYELQGNTAKALDYHKQFSALNDSIINETHIKAVGELEVKYDTEKKEKEILTLSEEQLRSKASLAKQRFWIVILASGIALLAGLFYGLTKITRQRQENKRQRELIEAITETQIAERKRISQDLHDSIGSMLALTSSQLKTAISGQQSATEKFTEPMTMLAKTAEQVRQISHNMMPGELMKFGLVSAIQTTLDNISKDKLQTTLHAHNMESRIDETKEVHIYRIFQEIIQNVIKHANAKTLAVYLNKHSKYLSLMVEDDGIGFQENQPTEGVGLKNIRARIAYLNGLLKIDSTPSNGTTFNIEIPIQ